MSFETKQDKERYERSMVMAARYDARQDIWTGEPLSQEICEELDREDELSRIRSEAAIS